VKKFLLTTVAFGVLALPAMAADMNPAPAPMYKAPIPVPVYTWTGCYIGGTVGGVWGKSTDNWAPSSGFAADTAAVIASQTAATLSSSGVTGGVEGGCNYQYTPWLVLGVEADWEATGLSATNNGSVAGVAPFTESFNSHWLSTVRGRAGYAAGPWLLYATGGVAIANTSFSDTLTIPPNAGFPASTNAFSQSHTSTGWTIGGGVEWMFAPHWTVKGEYLYVDVPGATFTSVNSAFAPATITHTHGDLKESIARVGVNYKFW
jgi:outer membrane immunogenic protein